MLKHWRAMREVDQLIIIIPTVLNLSGNLEMNLSARLGTASNVGELDDPIVRRSILIGSLALLQVQTISVSFVAACIALVLGKFVPTSGPHPKAPSLPLREFLSYSLDFREETPTIPVPVGRKSGIPTYVRITFYRVTHAHHY